MSVWERLEPTQVGWFAGLFILYVVSFLYYGVYLSTLHRFLEQAKARTPQVFEARGGAHLFAHNSPRWALATLALLFSQAFAADPELAATAARLRAMFLTAVCLIVGFLGLFTMGMLQLLERL